jgi:hypothetical protein
MSRLFGSTVRTKHSCQPGTLSVGRAMERMRTGSRLVHMHGEANGRHWFVVPGGAISEQTSIVIRNHPHVFGGRDGLFPNHDQTWRMRTFAQSV